VRQQRTPKPAWVKELEAQLTTVDSRATSVADFLAYLQALFRVQAMLRGHYDKLIHRVNRWHTWCDRRSSEDRFVLKVIEVFGEGVMIAYGDWAEHGSNVHGVMPGPVQSLLRRFQRQEGIEVVVTPEWYTTHTCARCHGLLVPDPERSYKHRPQADESAGIVTQRTPLRSIRRCNSATCGGLRRWVRDYNAPINIRVNLLHAIQHGTWHKEFCATKFYNSPKRRKQAARSHQEPQPPALDHHSGSHVGARSSATSSESSSVDEEVQGKRRRH
jgi:hypothetical protein